MQVAIRELKANLSRVLSLAQAGELVEVTSHNKPIARITGIPPQAGAGLRGLMANGALAWHGRKPQFEPPLRLGPGGTPVSRLVLEDRG